MRSLAPLFIFFIWTLTCVANAEDAAGSEWSQLQVLNDKANEKVPIGTNAVEFYASARESIARCCNRICKAIFQTMLMSRKRCFGKLRPRDFPDPAEQRIALLRQNETDARPIVDNAALPADVPISSPACNPRSMVGQSGPDHDVQPGSRSSRIESLDLVRKNPAEPRAVSFQLARVDLMLRFDHEKGMALLQELTKAPDQNLAEAAKARLLKEQMIGKPVDLQFTAVDGSSVDLQTLRGKIVLVDFWASWCPDCVRDMPAVRQTYQKYKDKGFAVIGISLDKDAQALSNFVARKLIPWPQYFDGKGWENEFATKYGVHAIPEMWLINQRGRCGQHRYFR